MSAKKGDLTLLLPGAGGWEIWKGTAAAGFSLHSETDHQRALDVTGYPSGPIQMALPIRQLAAMPFKAQTTDLDLLDDLAAMHLEKNGVRPALDNGTLADHFIYSQDAEETSLTAVVLNAPREGDLPRRSPEAFDLSPHCLPLHSGKVVVWKELNRWVFALGSGEKALYFQCLPGERLDERAGKDIKLSLAQLGLQGLLPETPEEIILWTSGGAEDARPEEIDALARGFNGSVNTSPKPSPHWPVPPSKLLPEDVRAERVEKAAKRTRNLAITALAFCYLGVVAYCYTNIKKTEKRAIAVEREVESTKEETGNLLTVLNKWDELTPVVEGEFYPYEVYYQVVRCLPNTPQRKIRISLATVVNQPKLSPEGVLVMDRRIVVTGQATDTSDIAKFAIALKASDELSGFEWNMPESQTKKDEWSFTYTAQVPQ
ncbi:hypothetical protein N9224_00110 [Akkermansiaceae bacterium]|nr:hypothetical protein [Akkermansiaceae bacterium]MDB4507983.1 hypothetical protein [Akkermansiaceae bacterium]